MIAFNIFISHSRIPISLSGSVEGSVIGFVTDSVGFTVVITSDVAGSVVEGSIGVATGTVVFSCV